MVDTSYGRIRALLTLCDRFYTAMSKLQIPLSTHGGEEKAVHGANTQDNGNPLHLKRALAHGLRVILAHCTMLDNDIDLDKGKYGPRVDSFELFSRMMGKPRYDGQLYGEISALTQANRTGRALLKP